MFMSLSTAETDTEGSGQPGLVGHGQLYEVQ